MSGPGPVAAKGEWSVKTPEGYYDAVQATGTMIAPILAGFAFAILALVLIPPGKEEADPLRWRDPVLALLVVSALFLIISTQAAIRARANLVKPDELRAWYPLSVDEAGRPNQWLAERQRLLEQRTARASTACRHTYNAGTLLFFTAIAVLLVPSGPVDDARRAVLGAATVAVAVEAAWLTGASMRPRHLTERLPTLLTPTSYAVTAVVIMATSSSNASRVAAAGAIAISAAATGTAAIRLTFRGARGWLQAVGGVMLAATVSAAVAAALLLDHWGRAPLVADITAAALLILLTLAVLPATSLK
ncbi:MAG TPA: hypothetical protein VF506_07755 [Streptosporangiaceae bacterium]